MGGMEGEGSRVLRFMYCAFFPTQLSHSSTTFSHRLFSSVYIFIAHCPFVIKKGGGALGGMKHQEG